MEQKLFFKTYGPAVVESTRGTGLFPSVKLAQMALETGYGKTIKTAANNAYGIKAGKSWKGKVISNSTFEYVGTKRIDYAGTNKVYPSYQAAIDAGENIVNLFRVYPSVADSIKDHSQLLMRPRYAKAMAASTPEDQARLIKEAGYATGYNYGKILVDIINDYNLKEWDKKKDL